MDVNESFWDISFSNPDASGLNDLVPNYDAHDSLLDSQDFEALYTVTLSERAQEGGCLSVSVVESREEGVLSRVSTEVWEASLLLSAFLIQDTSLLSEMRGAAVLELGCGCGLAGLVALGASMRAGTPLSRLVLSDADSAALRGIQKALGHQRDLVIQPILTDPAHCPAKGTTLCLQRLDWRDYPISASPSHERELRPLSADSVGLIVGSALVYSPAHVVLADVLRLGSIARDPAILISSSHFLKGSCRRAVLLQIHDRPGFALFLLRLEVLTIHNNTPTVLEYITHPYVIVRR